MNFIKNEILDGVKSLNIDSIEISHETFNLQRDFLENKFCKASSSSPFVWERLDNFYSIQSSEAWKLINKILGNEPIIMFFDKNSETSAFKFKSANDVVSILSECIGFEFYLTNEKSDFILCLNHHDYLIAVGPAVENLKNLLKNK